jgi:ABC-type nitrate/sulfonate/bicarbonate transport system ATPase subunit
MKISLTNVSRSCVARAGSRVQALKDVNIEIADEFASDGADIGEFRVILGPSGCGKSTVLRLIAGLDKPDSGEVLMDGKRVAGPGSDRGMVFQKYTSFAWLTVAQNIAYGLDIQGAPEAERKAIVEHLIDATGLRGFENAYPRTLSGGMQQRVAIARTLAVRPRVILMDEPFGALDAQTRNDMQNLLLKVWAESACTVLFVTHDVAEAVYLADRIYIMTARPGSILEEITVPFARPREESIRQSRDFQDLEDHVLSRLRAAAAGSGQIRVTV